MESRAKRTANFAVILVLMALPLVGWMQRWNIYDAARLYGYSAPTKIAQLATDDTMNDKTRRLYYANHPELDDKQTFNDNCKFDEKTIVLGCFVQARGIYIFNVTDPRLSGELQVTVAHETLHAAYQRLSGSEKTRVNKLIDEAYAKVTDQRIKDTIADYKQHGADTTNELHSILGTEVRDLPPELEQYYARYFVNRKKIVSYSEVYEAAFSQRKALADQYLAQINSLKSQIDSSNAELTAQKTQLDAQSESLQSQRGSTDPATYNARVDSFNAQVAVYNAKVRRSAGLIDQYNDIVKKYNDVASEENDLAKAIDSRPSTISN